ncbi:MAG: HlyD family secretion protein [Betaproteobacteria bacterium]|nr:HlyD family secretion protein [Betaproteobacteria bacterium]
MNEVNVEETEKPKRKLPRLILLAAFFCLALWLAYKWWWGLSHVTTDNAQIESHIIQVLPKVGGFVTAVKVTDNQAVHAGDLLVAIDERDFKVKLAQAEAELALAEANAGRQSGRIEGQAAAQVAASRAAAAAARSAIEQALANADKAQKDLERVRSLVAQKMVSPQALDAAEAAARAALAQVRSSRDLAASAGEQVTASSAALRAALAKVDAARAARDFAANQLVDTRVLAPVDGVVSNKSVEPGQLVQAGQPLLAVVPLNDIWVVANLKETDLRNIQPGAPVEMQVDAYPGLAVEGSVESLSPATGARFSLLPPDNATGNFTKVVQRVPVRIRLSQSKDTAHPLRPGMSVFVTITTNATATQ